MKTALIMGITGAFGAEVAMALQAEGWTLKALLRDPARLPEAFRGIAVVQGDVCDPDAIKHAVEGVELVVYGVNPPKYDWKEKALPWLDNTARIIEAYGLTLVFPGNVYALDPSQGPDYDEKASLTGLTPKGQIHRAMEERLQLAADRGARIINLRLGDFFSASLESSWLKALIKPNKTGYTLATPGPVDLKHTWAYLPDVAHTLALLLEKRQELPAYALFHYQGYQASLNEIATALRQVTDQPVRLTRFPWPLLRLLTPFSALFQGLWEMRYLWRHDIRLNDRKLKAFLGRPLPRTPMIEALAATLPGRLPQPTSVPQSSSTLTTSTP